MKLLQCITKVGFFAVLYLEFIFISVFCILSSFVLWWFRMLWTQHNRSQCLYLYGVVCFIFYPCM